MEEETSPKQSSNAAAAKCEDDVFTTFDMRHVCAISIIAFLCLLVYQIEYVSPMSSAREVVSRLDKATTDNPDLRVCAGELLEQFIIEKDGASQQLIDEAVKRCEKQAETLHFVVELRREGLITAPEKTSGEPL